MTTPFEHTINILPAYDKRATNHGIHGCDMIFTCKKDNKGVTLTIFTNWHLPSVDTSAWPKSISGPMAADISYHDSKEHYSDQHCRDECLVTGGKCYSDGSGLMAEEYFQCLIEHGYDVLKKKMEELYVDWLEKEFQS